MKNLNSKNADFENVSTDNLSFNSVNSDTPQSVNDVLAWNGSSWEVKAAQDLGIAGGGSDNPIPSSFETNIPAGVKSFPVTYGPFGSTPRIASSLEIDGEGEIIPYTTSGVSATGYHVIFSDATPNTNYNIHTVFGGDYSHWEQEYGGKISVTGVNVGIGTTNPHSTLAVQDSSHGCSMQLGSASGEDQYQYINFANEWQIGKNPVVGSIGQAGSLYVYNIDQSKTNLCIDTAGNVGIGTTNPGEILVIEHDSSPTLQIKDGGAGSANSRTAGRLHLGESSSLGVSIENYTHNYNDACSMIFKTTVATGSITERMRINPAGNVGIGTTSPTSKLDVVDNDSSIQLSVRGRSSDNFGIIDFKNNAGTASKGMIKSDESNKLMFRAGPTSDVLTLLPDGNVGIGTTNPDSALEVIGTDPSNNVSRVVNIKDDRSYAADVGGGISLYGKYNSAGGYSTFAQIIGAKTNGTDGDYSGFLAFKTRSASSLPAERMRINSAGNVGIGTSSPVARFTVAGDVDGSEDVLHLTTNDPGMDASQGVGLTFGQATQRFAKIEGVYNNSSNYSLNFHTSNFVQAEAFDYDAGKRYSANPSLSILGNGNVGIGTTNPDTSLSVVGDIRLGTFESALPSDNKMYYIKSAPYSWSGLSGVTNEIASIGLGSPHTGQDDGAIFFSTTFDANLGGTLTERARINGNGALCINSVVDNGYKLYVSGGIFGTSGTLASDDRVKHNEKTIIGALETLSKITPKKYIKTIEMYDADHDFELDADGNPIDESGEPVEHRIEAGVIAQQVLAVDELAFAVSAEGVDEDGVVTSPHGLDYNSLFTYAIAAIQEQQQLIESQQSTINDLISRVESLES